MQQASHPEPDASVLGSGRSLLHAVTAPSMSLLRCVMGQGTASSTDDEGDDCGGNASPCRPGALRRSLTFAPSASSSKCGVGCPRSTVMFIHLKAPLCVRTTSVEDAGHDATPPCTPCAAAADGAGAPSGKRSIFARPDGGDWEDSESVSTASDCVSAWSRISSAGGHTEDAHAWEQQALQAPSCGSECDAQLGGKNSCCPQDEWPERPAALDAHAAVAPAATLA